MCISRDGAESGVWSRIGAWEPETVTFRGLGTDTASGTYSLMLLFLACPSAFFCLFTCALVRPDSLAFVMSPWYARLFDWFAIADDIDSPFAVTSAESAVMGNITSRDVGRETSFFQGPGESPDISGEGKGVTSAIALSIGDDRAEFGAEPKFELLPTLLAKIFLILGVRVMPVFEGMRINSCEERAVFSVLAAVMV